MRREDTEFGQVNVDHEKGIIRVPFKMRGWKGEVVSSFRDAIEAYLAAVVSVPVSHGMQLTAYLPLEPEVGGLRDSVPLHAASPYHEAHPVHGLLIDIVVLVELQTQPVALS